MKSMHDRKMDMKAGQPDSDGFFPESAHVHHMKRAGEIRGFKYPDTEEMVHADTNDSVMKVTKELPKHGYRH